MKRSGRSGDPSGHSDPAIRGRAARQHQPPLWDGLRPGWSATKTYFNGTLREGMSAFLGAVMGGLWDERPFDRGRTRRISPCARYIVDAACHLRSGFWDAQYVPSSTIQRHGHRHNSVTGDTGRDGIDELRGGLRLAGPPGRIERRPSPRRSTAPRYDGLGRALPARSDEAAPAWVEIGAGVAVGMAPVRAVARRSRPGTSRA